MQIKNYSKLKGRTKELGLLQSDVAKAANMNKSTYSLKLQGRYPFKQNEIDSIVTLLHIPLEQIGEFFFTNKVQ